MKSPTIAYTTFAISKYWRPYPTWILLTVNERKCFEFRSKVVGRMFDETQNNINCLYSIISQGWSWGPSLAHAFSLVVVQQRNCVLDSTVPLWLLAKLLLIRRTTTVDVNEWKMNTKWRIIPALTRRELFVCYHFARVRGFAGGDSLTSR